MCELRKIIPTGQLQCSMPAWQHLHHSQHPGRLPSQPAGRLVGRLPSKPAGRPGGKRRQVQVHVASGCSAGGAEPPAV